MRKKLLGTMMCAALTASLLAGCSGKAAGDNHCSRDYFSDKGSY